MQSQKNHPPEARPIAFVSYARHRTISTYPHILLPRGAAAIDIVILLIAFETFTLALSLSALPEKLPEWLPGVGFLGLTFFIGTFSLLLVAGCLLIRKQSPTIIGLNKPKPVRFWIATAVGLPACYAAGLIGAMVYTMLFPMSFETLTQEKMDLLEIVPKMHPVVLLSISIFVGIHEEVFFRGFLLSRLRSVVRSDVFAIVASGIIFGLGHGYQGLLGVFQIAAIGIALATLTVCARTIWPAIIAHAGLDAVSLWLAPYFKTLIEDVMQQMQTMDATTAPAAILLHISAVSIS